MCGNVGLFQQNIFRFSSISFLLWMSCCMLYMTPDRWQQLIDTQWAFRCGNHNQINFPSKFCFCFHFFRLNINPPIIWALNRIHGQLLLSTETDMQIAIWFTESKEQSVIAWIIIRLLHFIAVYFVQTIWRLIAQKSKKQYKRELNRQHFNCAKQQLWLVGWFCFSPTIYKMISIILAASTIIFNYYYIYYLNLNDSNVLPFNLVNCGAWICWRINERLFY